MDKLTDIRKHNLLVLDIETAMSHASFSDMKAENDSLAEEFSKRFKKEIAERLESLQEDNPNSLIDHSVVADSIYREKAPLNAEYGRVISCSFTTLKYDRELGDFATTTKSFMGHDEAELLTKINTVLSKDGWFFAGMNLNAFDIPFLLKRMMIHGIQPTSRLTQQVFSKPWERNIIDVADIWAFGGFGKGVALGAICAALGVRTPKGGVYGPLVPTFYWTGKCPEVYDEQVFSQDEALNIIDDYCQKDTEATAQCLVKLNQILFA